MRRIIILLTLLTLNSNNLFGQAINDIKFSKNEIVRVDGKTTTKPYLRFKHFDEMRGITPSTCTNLRKNAIDETNILLKNSSKYARTQAQQPEWRNIGPFKVSGRVKTIAIHPENENIVYIGAAAGGIWRSIDAGDSWEPIFDYENAIGFGSIDIDVNNPDIIYAGTGEAVMNSAAPMYIGGGVYKSTDAGDSWKVIGLTEIGAISKIYVHPQNSNIIVVGAVSANRGFYYSTDAGNSWKKSDDFNKNVSDVTFNPSNENEYFVGVIGEGVFQTTNLGESWQKQSNGLPESTGRVSVQFAPSAPDILYTLLEESGIGNIYKSTDHGQSWVKSLKGTASFFNGQGFYNNYIMVHPENPDICFAGGIDVWKTTNGGPSSASWINITKGYSGGSVHVDHHCLAFNPQNPNQIYIGNDGGVYKSNSLGSSFTEINNGLEITQFYSIDVDKNELNRTFGGTQDNGTLGNHVNSDKWRLINGGDGFQTVLNTENINIIYGEVYIGGNLKSIYPFRRNVITGQYSLLTNGISATDKSGIWDPPLEIHPLYGDVLYHGRKALYISYNGGNSWSKETPEQANKFTAIAASAVNEEIVYAGDIAGGLIVTEDHFETLREVSGNGLIGRTITDIAPSPINEKTAFITFSGFGMAHVFKTTDIGESWTNISQEFPDIPSNTIVVHPNNEDWIYVGTDIGVFATFNGGDNWLPFGMNLPRTIITDMKIMKNPQDDSYILRAATFGRSIWEVTIPAEEITEPEITSPAGGEIIVGTSPMMIAWHGFELPVSIDISYDDGETWNLLAKDIDDNSYRFIAPNKDLFSIRIKISSKQPSEIYKISNSFSISPVKRGSVLQTSSFGHVPYGIAWDGKDHLWSTSFYTNKLYKINSTNFQIVDNLTIPGDSLFTDLTIDREENTFYIHRMNSSGNSGTGGVILKLDAQGKKITSYQSPAKEYPVGLELIDEGMVVCDRDGFPKKIYVVDPSSGSVWSKVDNPFQGYLGPRGICYDGVQYLYQASTLFSSDAGIAATYIIKINKNDLSTEVDRISLEGRNGPINCRGIEYDQRDKNFWLTDFGGNIYKVAGFETIVDVDDSFENNYSSGFEAKIFPNPMSDYATISFNTKKSIYELKINIIDVLGRNVKTIKKSFGIDNNFSSINVDGNNLKSGIYTVVFSNYGKILLKKKLIIIK